MRRNNSARILKRSNLNGAKVVSDPVIRGDTRIWTTTLHRIDRARESRRLSAYPRGSIGRDLLERAYISYLVERYNRFRQVEFGFGGAPPGFNYAFIFRDIEAKFQAPTYLIPRTRFNDLAEYLQKRIDATMLGKRNRAREIRNYPSPEEFAAEQAAE